jgi:hypothetical protein
MRRSRIRIAMDAGKRWAEQQLKSGINVTPSSAEEAANQKFTHMGSRHLFWCAALDTALQENPGKIAKNISRPASENVNGL